MRHLWSLLAGVVVAPLAWGLIALGQNGSREQVGDWVSTGRFDTVDLIEPAAYLVVAGILLGLIATLRVSPLGPLAGGLLLIAAYVGLFISPLNVREAIPDNWEILDRDLALHEPLDNGTLALVGVLLLMAVFSAGRWRRWPAAATDATDTTDVPAADSDVADVPAADSDELLTAASAGESETEVPQPEPPEPVAAGVKPDDAVTAESTSDKPAPSPTPAPAPAPAQKLTPTPASKPTPVPTPAPEPTPTSTPTVVPKPAAKPAPKPTPVPKPARPKAASPSPSPSKAAKHARTEGTGESPWSAPPGKGPSDTD